LQSFSASAIQFTKQIYMHGTLCAVAVVYIVKPKLENGGKVCVHMYGPEASLSTKRSALTHQTSVPQPTLTQFKCSVYSSHCANYVLSTP